MEKNLKKLNNTHSLEELNHWLVDASFNKKVLQQIEKDFSQSDLSLDIESPEIISLMQEHIEKLLHDDFAKLMNLLYRIDLSESKIESLRAYDPTMPERDVITFLVIQREMQKVMFREMYKNRL
ncbi:hypothetical protein L21SP5_02263 [Salinivirga cyanobacteriivorans]|uniref:Uncharacterized protein n=1 Tax=Salinivirga cyanobacteriivorans TaxID=1307839 RepID=A0A0S2I0L1_9BACT|nr:hypothetical protein [Salinivirga cyanobacteriivorans]ALO15896.1 hypothetical protein L21SP5_02263 [Salinivirga cyanobacteriivorans]